MKRRAAILLLVWGVVMVQPSFAYFGGKSGYNTCTEKETTKPSCQKKKTPDPTCKKQKVLSTDCSKKKCSIPVNPEDKKNCGTDGCNPTLGCSSGNFYVHQHHQILLPTWFAQKQKAILIDDNRIIKSMSECWHPPEA